MHRKKRKKKNMPIKNTKYVKIESQDTPIIKFIDTEDRKYGISLNDILGDVGLDGVYRGGSSNKPFAINFDGIVEFEAGAGFGGFAYNFIANRFLKGVDFASVRYIRTSRLFCQAFYRCPNLEYARFPNLVSIGDATQDSYWVFDNAFRECPMLEELDMPKLESVYDETSMRSFVYGCSRLKRINLPSLKEIRYRNNGMIYFAAETAIEEMKFQSLSYIGNYGLQNAFYNCLQLKNVWFYALETLNSGAITLTNMLRGCSGVTVHFPMDMESTMGGWSSVTSGFSGTDTTVLFDLVRSIVGANGVTYSRQEKSSVDGATAWVIDGDLYYTAGNEEPEVNDAIFSDPTCVNVVTVITSRS